MKILATKGTYNKINKLLNYGIFIINILLVIALFESDKPKVEELINVGTTNNVKNIVRKIVVELIANKII
uniref:Uncharacterized protein n=1 Tax=Physcomitrium patens TaxID=3218 RepID=A0A2K1KEZ7_PHYPA|nr:hypothetical protein PHYPA_008724 [Physcomitrium patens]